MDIATHENIIADHVQFIKKGLEQSEKEVKEKTIELNDLYTKHINDSDNIAFIKSNINHLRNILDKLEKHNKQVNATACKEIIDTVTMLFETNRYKHQSLCEHNNIIESQICLINSELSLVQKFMNKTNSVINYINRNPKRPRQT